MTQKMTKQIAARAELKTHIRQFFHERGVLEVDTPVFGTTTVTDPYIESFQAGDFYLQTSPEFFMKRLLCTGSPSIYQMGPVFRSGECGRNHQPEFTMLEWYRLNFDHYQLMSEVDALLRIALSIDPTTHSQYETYEALFQNHCGVDPHTANASDLKRICQYHGVCDWETNKSGYLDLLMTHIIEPTLGADAPCFVYNYPTDQAALAKLSGERAERFEVYFKGIELANGFHELQSVDEQRERFKTDLQRRRDIGAKAISMDHDFLEALAQGLPNCAGVALGFDRLLMLAQGTTNIADVMFFPK